MNEWTFAPALSIAAAIKARTISATDILEHYLDRIERLNPALNAVIVLDADRARTRARAADAAASRGEDWGPLHGVPMTLKEAFDIAGLPTTWGFEAYRDNIATTDSLAAKRFTSAGAILFGKTNVPIALSDWQTFNPVYGTTNNPWDHDRTPGGSSGGSAAALAAGLTGLEAGSDIGASIRNPAHYCGVYGHKPTMAIVSSKGHSLPDWRNTPELDIAVIGPMARSAHDLAIALDVMAGPDEIDAVGWQLNLPRDQRRSLSDFRVGIIYTDPEAEVDEAVQQQLRDVAKFLRRSGSEVIEGHKPAIASRDAHDTYIALLRAATSAGVDPAVFNGFQQRAQTLAPTADDYPAKMVRGATLSHRDWLFINETRHGMRRAWAEYFKDTDLLLCPAATTVAFEHNQQGERWERMIDVNGQPQPTTTPLFWAGYSGHVYLPSTVAPIGLSAGGLPVGMQIIGPQYQDHRCIRFAQLLEDHYRGFTVPENYS